MTRTVVRILLALAVSATTLRAHSDPRGDVHPQVRVENGNFAVYFSNNADPNANPDPNQPRPVLRVVYSGRGDLLAPRHRVKTMPPPERSEMPAGMEGGMIVSAGGEKLIFPQYPRLFHGKPFYFIETGKRFERRRLAWPKDVTISGLHSIHADARSITLAAKAGKKTLLLYRFERGRLDLPTIVPVGDPEEIYDFAVASNLVLAGERYWIAWVRAKASEKKFETVLSSWRPGEAQASHVVLDAPSDWNAHLSLAASGGFLCLAYHCSLSGEYPGTSEIVTRFHPLAQ